MLSWVAWHNDERALGNRRRAVSLSPYELRSLQCSCEVAKAETVTAARAAQHICGVCTQRVLHRAAKKLQKRATKQCAHRALPLPRPRHRHAHAQHATLCTRARACRARSSRTLHACTPRQRPTCSHLATRTCTSKARMACSSHWPLADRRPAGRWHIWHAHALRMRSPSPLLARPMLRPHAVHAIHHHRCHRVHRS